MVDVAGLRALVVEDEGAVALLIEDMLLDLGCEIAATAAELAKACQLARAARIDFAILDMNLAGASALPVAQILRERGIPFLFSTGYGTSAVSGDFEAYPVAAKPFVMVELRDKIVAALELAKGRDD
jgi:CheY-like chemotaxis protein